MFYAIIVDDEQTIRDGIAKYISRSFPEINVLGVFPDGKDAIEFLKTSHADIILTDIRMSEKSGIDVAKFVFENAIESKVVFLSAYQEFEYAKQAIKYGVKNYLSKPVRLSELKEVLNELIEEFCITQENRNNAQKDYEDLQTLMTIIKRDFYCDILLGILKTRDELVDRADKICLNKDFLSQTQCSIFSFSALPGAECYYGSDELYNCELNLLREINGSSSVIPLMQNGHDAIFVSELSGFSSSEELFENMHSSLTNISDNAAKFLCIDAKFEILFYGESIFDLLDYRFPNNSTGLDSSLIDDKIKSLLSDILSHDYPSAKNTLDDLSVYSQSLSISDSKSLMIKLFSKISSVIFGEFTDSSTSFKSAHNRQELFEKGNEALSSVFEKASDTEDIENPVIIKAKKFIHNNLSEDIGLDDIAGHVYLNPVYFSRFFKQHTGQTLTEYITKKRINLACDMLCSHKYRINDISRACGYKSSKYFAKIFKQHTGQTPSEYSKIK